LRQRRSDIPALARALLARLEPEVGDKVLSSAALARLVEHDWPGNVRELGSVLYRASLVSRTAMIGAAELELPATPMANGCPTAPLASPEHAAELLARHGGNVSAAARAAGVPRTTFRGWLGRT
jgi:DNA-binding NtrC family response regulator